MATCDWLAIVALVAYTIPMALATVYMAHAAHLFCKKGDKK